MKKVIPSNKSIRKSIFKSMMIYVIGFSITALFYFSSDGHYAHAPGPHHLIFLLTMGIGFIGLILAIIRYLIRHETEVLGHLIVNGIAVISFLIWWNLYATLRPEKIESAISVEYKGDTITVYHKHSPVYYKIGDSVYFDFRDPEYIEIEEY